MVVVMIENVYPVSNKEERVAGRSRKLPRNIRACGQSGGALPVYMEDYVGTYIRRLTESGYPECSAVVLVGQVMETEIGRCLFVRGAINANVICEGDRPVFGEDVWNEVYEKIRLYFPCDEVVGWCVAGPGFRLLQEEVFLRAHIDNFADREKIFCCYESLEKELVLRICEGGHFRILPGYYVYYEKNDEMQNYMLQEATFVRKIKREEDGETSERETTREAGELKMFDEIQKKKAGKSGSIRKDVMQIAAIACIIVLIVSVMMGTDTLTKLKESFFAIGEDVKGEQPAADESEKLDEEEGKTEDSEELAFGNFDFLDEKLNSDDLEKGQGEVEKQENAEQQEAEQTGQSKEEQQETIPENPDETDEQEITQEGQDEAERQEVAQRGEEEDEKQNEAENPDRIEEETVTVLSPAEYTSYTVKAGDTLAQVCKEVYGSVELLHYVCELNQLKDIDSIYVGQELILPKK